MFTLFSSVSQALSQIENNVVILKQNYWKFWRIFIESFSSTMAKNPKSFTKERKGSNPLRMIWRHGTFPFFDKKIRDKHWQRDLYGKHCFILLSNCIFSRFQMDVFSIHFAILEENVSGKFSELFWNPFRTLYHDHALS